MASIAVEPLYMSECTFTVASDSYEAALSGVTITPTTPTSTWTGLKAGSVFTKAGKATWTCVLDYMQDWNTTGSLSNYLLANEGSSIDVVFVPDDGGASISVTLIVVPGAIGGKVNSFAEATATLPVQGRPTLTAGA
ncbi:hypothetical protein HII28_00385 [Planctomonas sp. JC2975]|uniref:hypothetical protein n=1 Tax=Planctomonas sp. JC2975 TaxID=2729626 RepID=UPI001473EB4D|nr:hypothetical protein [Planctomonas sp. JC2975]NNC10342.1 hypothetical protein [Planctomonas sp. JC2975]